MIRVPAAAVKNISIAAGKTECTLALLSVETENLGKHRIMRQPNTVEDKKSEKTPYNEAINYG